MQVPCDLDPASERVARAWLKLREGVVWSLSDEPRITDRRHRIWAASRTGVPLLPLRVSEFDFLTDALVDRGDEPSRAADARWIRDEITRPARRC